MVTDSNVVAQESGINTLQMLLTYGGAQTLRLRSAIVPALCEKGLSSSRAGTKQKVTECLMLFIELDTADPVIEAMIPSLSARLPKLVSGVVKALVDIYSAFGAETISPKLVLPSLSKLFSHADRTVRLETSNLTVELYKWMGPALETILFSELKPVQQKDLTKAFEKCNNEKAVQTRFLKSQKAAETSGDANAELGLAENDGDVVMVDQEPKSIDPYDLVEPVNVLAKLPTDLSKKLSEPKWKDRVETLTDVAEKLNVVKMADDDYFELFKVLAKSIKDVNIQVVSLAAKSIESLCKGLRQRFHKYHSIVLNPLLERLKEKKQSVLDSLNSALDSVFQYTSMSDILPDTVEALKSKIPQVRLSSTQFLTRCLKTTQVAPNKSEVESIITIGVKLVCDTLPDIRNNASELVGVLMKITGERELNRYLENLDDIKKKKIKQYFEDEEIKIKIVKNAKPSGSKADTPLPSASGRAASSLAPPKQAKPSGSMLRKKSLLPNSTIPSKRPPTSPLKSDKSSAVSSTTGRGGLTGRSLQYNSASAAVGIGNSNTNAHTTSITSIELQELQELRQEKQSWLNERSKLTSMCEEANKENNKLARDIEQYSAKIDKLNEQHTNDIMTIKSKETQLQRVFSDLEISRLKISQLESEIELLQKQKNTSLYLTGGLNKAASTALQDLNNNEILGNKIDHIDEKVSNLSINSGAAAAPPAAAATTTVPAAGEAAGETGFKSVIDTNDESWRRAAEVTSQLKARIEKMKAKSRHSLNR